MVEGEESKPRLESKRKNEQPRVGSTPPTRFHTRQPSRSRRRLTKEHHGISVPLRTLLPTSPTASVPFRPSAFATGRGGAKRAQTFSHRGRKDFDESTPKCMKGNKGVVTTCAECSSKSFDRTSSATAHEHELLVTPSLAKRSREDQMLRADLLNRVLYYSSRLPSGNTNTPCLPLQLRRGRRLRALLSLLPVCLA